MYSKHSIYCWYLCSLCCYNYTGIQWQSIHIKPKTGNKSFQEIFVAYLKEILAADRCEKDREFGLQRILSAGRQKEYTGRKVHSLTLKYSCMFLCVWYCKAMKSCEILEIISRNGTGSTQMNLSMAKIMGRHICNLVTPILHILWTKKLRKSWLRIL